MKTILRASLLLICGTIFCQPSSENKPDNEFQAFLYHIIVTASSNPAKALYLADSVYTHSSSQRKKSRALMLTASILEKENREIEGIHYALKALTLTKEQKDYSFEARIYGFLATQNRNIGFYDEGEHYLNRGIAAISKIDDKSQIERYTAMANHELAEIAYEKEDLSKALNHIDLSILSYKKESSQQERFFILATAYQLKGRILHSQNKTDESVTYLQKAVHLIDKAGAEKSIHAGLIYQSIGDHYLKEKIMDSAGIYLLRAMESSKSSDNELVKELTMGSLTEYYREIGDTEKLDSLQSKYHTILKANKQNKKQKVNNLHVLLKNNREKEENSKTKRSWSFYTGSTIAILTISGVGFFIFRRNKQVRNNRKTKTPEATQKPKKTVVELKISKETEQQIAKNIEIFEHSKQFLRPDISFPKLATSLKTNTKYLNYYLKKHFNKDYTTYINDLRINYIIARVENNKAYRKYKISYLAKESGFSSHSTFSANFKRVTGFSPSEYVEGLKNE